MSAKQSNRLISEKSPYLLQHAYNPVDWYPWGEQAFEKARNEGKPIFLSIGYSACHWCHVMEKESFEDEEVARLMNEAFVCIKVDREERPDIDSVYMTICQTITGSGGWPLTIIMTSDKKPFFASTYIPKETKFRRMGMKDLIPAIQTFWESKRDEALGSADKVFNILEQTSAYVPGSDLEETTLHIAYEQLSKNFDKVYGGFGKGPKFPAPQNLFFLLRYWRRTGNEQALMMVEKTLSSMRLGGIYDHLGFGFHRYSTDSRWFVPHFEKMLYDQALLAIAYMEAYQAANMKKEYGQTAREIFHYLLRDMTHPEGGFYSAEDADINGDEGRFYTWSQEEIEEILSDREAELATRIFNVKQEGNFQEEATGRESGRNILYMEKSIPDIASELEMPLGELQELLEEIRKKLFGARKKRPNPYKDDKILTDWNGLMIAALAKGAQVFGEGKYLEAAKRSADFILSEMCNKEGRLLHRYRDGEAAIPAFLDDYAFLTWGLLEIYETSFESVYLKRAFDFNSLLLDHFWDGKNGGFYSVADYADKILIRKKEIYDGAVPSGNSIAMLNLLRLARITANPEYEEKAAQMSITFSEMVSVAPAAFTQMMVALDFALGPSLEVVITGNPESEDTKAMFKALRGTFLPGKVVLFRSTEREDPDIAHYAEFTKELSGLEGKATAYVCKNYRCELPTTDPKEMMSLINQAK
ncbi:MAG TPA: thioredoxin domain-containing protein [Desulfatiglandales bacterium]|nr:thioredoxin domain-containing protein [Desulfatiglandales bacterium]